MFKEEKAIVGTHIKRIDKFDELTNHFLSTYVAHCIRKKGILKPRELAMETSVDSLPLSSTKSCSASNLSDNFGANANLKDTII